ncbi:MAG: rhodanese-like domain-containing protein [Bacteroidota bacterium]
MGFFTKIKNSLFGPGMDYKQMIQNGAIVVDVRSPQEFKGGHAPGSKNIPLGNLSSKVSELKGKEVILVCLSGGRAGQAKNILTQAGITAHNAGPWQRVR